MSRPGLVARLALPQPDRLIRAAVQTVMDWQGRKRTRAALARLDAHMLRDVGLDAAHAESEAAKPFWRD